MADIDSSLPIHTFNKDSVGATAANVIVGLFDENEVRVSPLTVAGFTAGLEVQTDGITAAIESQTAGLTAQMEADVASIESAISTQTDGITGAIDSQTVALAADLETQTAGITGALNTELEAQTAGLTAQMVADAAGITAAIELQTSDLSTALDAQTAGLTAQMVSDTADIISAVDAVSAQLPAALGATASAGSLSVVMATDQTPMPVYVTHETPAVPVVEHKTAAIAGSAVLNHSFTPSAKFELDNVWASASGRIKVEVRVAAVANIGDAAAIRWVGFNSTANSNVDIPCSDYSVAVGEMVRVDITNMENQTQSVYSTIVGDGTGTAA